MIQKLIFLAIGIAVCILLLFALRKMFKAIYKKKEAIHLKFLNSACNVVIILMCIYYAMSLFDVTKDAGKIFLQSGTVIIAVATFAAQQAMGNVISGISLSTAKPFDVGEKIKVINGSNVVAEGIVKDITLRQTVIMTYDGQSAIIPNSVMDNSVILNTNYTKDVGSFLEIEVSYDSNIDKSMEIIKRLCIEHELTLNDDEMAVRISQLTENGVKLKTTVWTRNLDDSFKACSDIRGEVLKAFKENGITIPYTTITITRD